jgi:hypothetical protein
LVALIGASRTIDVAGPIVALAPRTANRPTQEFGLLVLLLRKAVAAPELVPTWLLLATRRLGVAFGALLMRRRTTVLVATAVMPLVAVAVAPVMTVIVAMIVAITVAIAVLLVSAAMTFETLALHARLTIVMAHLRGRLHLAVVTLVVAVVVAINLIVRHTAVHPVTTLGDLLIAHGHDDAVVVLGVLQVVLGQHWVAGGRRIAGERHVLLGDV